MRKILGGLCILAMLAACGDDEVLPRSDAGGAPTPDAPPGGGGPFDDLPIAATVVVPGLGGQVDVVRDRFGVPHIHAPTMADAAFANGYVMASDRISQMDLFRHYAEATLAELFGGLAPDQIEVDMSMRMHRMRYWAEQSWMELQSSADPFDAELVTYLTRYSDGVNQYLTELQAGDHELDPLVAQFFNPETTAPWTPVDSLAIGRLQAWNLSYDTSDIGITSAYQRAREQFDLSADPAHLARAGIFRDVLAVAPPDPTSTIAGFPNVDTDSGSRAKPGRRRRGPTRPRVPQELLDRAAHAAGKPAALARVLGNPGSNNWVVGPSLAGGKTLLANDPHLQLINPPIWYLIQITVPGELDVTGVSFPGIPGVVLGHNAHFAWGATVVAHDVTDVYAETIAPCESGGGDCVAFRGGQVAIEPIEETIKVGVLGTIIEERHATYEIVPHHGPIVPDIQNGQVVPRTGSQALSVAYTGYAPTQEIRAIFALNKAATVADGFAALDEFSYGAQNWVMIDDQGGFGWTTTAKVPLREADCYTFDPVANPTGLAPFLVAPGSGGCEWEGWMDSRYIPHAISPEAGFLASANQDPVGATFDGDPFNQAVVDGRPLYLSAYSYDDGLRNGRITRRLQALAGSDSPITMDDLGSIQADAHSNFGDLLRPVLVDAVAQVSTPGSLTDVNDWVAGLTEERRQRLIDAGARLAAWSLDTPAGVEGTPGAAEIADSTATSIFNLWIDGAAQRVLGDEGFGGRWTLVRVLLHPDELETGLAAATGQPLLCDDLGTAEVTESCTLEVLMALDAGLTNATNRFGTATMDDWRWGKIHTLTLEVLTPTPDLNIPPPDDPNFPNGYPRHGECSVVDVACGFAYTAGPSMRHITEMSSAGPTTWMQLPGGQTYDRASPHFRDLIDTYWDKNEYFELPFTVTAVHDEFESRWVLTP